MLKLTYINNSLNHFTYYWLEFYINWFIFINYFYVRQCHWICLITFNNLALNQCLPQHGASSPAGTEGGPRGRPEGNTLFPLLLGVVRLEEAVGIILGNLVLEPTPSHCPGWWTGCRTQGWAAPRKLGSPGSPGAAWGIGGWGAEPATEHISLPEREARVPHTWVSGGKFSQNKGSLNCRGNSGQWLLPRMKFNLSGEK